MIDQSICEQCNRYRGSWKDNDYHGILCEAATKDKIGKKATKHSRMRLQFTDQPPTECKYLK